MSNDKINLDKALLDEDARDLYENAPCGYISAMPDGTIIKVNETFLRWTGYSRESLLLVKRFQALLTVAGRIYHDTHYGPLLQMQGFVNELAFEIICADGQRLPVLLNSTLKKDNAGKPLLIRTTLLDARGRRTYEKELLLAKRRAEDAENALRQLNENLESEVLARTAERDRLWRLSRDILAVGTMDGYFIRCNPAFSAILGWTEAEATSMRFMDFVHPGEIEEFRQAMSHLAAGHPIIDREVRRRHKDGSYRWLLWNIVPEGEQLFFFGRDISEEKKQADALHRAEDELRQAQKMESVGQLTGGLAHDFNNLLAGIVGNLQLMRVRIGQGINHDLLRYVNAAETVAERAAALTQRMLAFARRQTLDPKVIDVNELVVSMKDLFRQTVGSSIQMELRLGDPIWATLTDRNQLESALLNLVINARDAMPGGGSLFIGTENVTSELPAGASTSKTRDTTEYVAIKVTDNGTGMAPDVASRAFDPFFTTKPIGQGTGLGLSMIFGFVKQSGGHVRIDSSPGKGTTVSLYLPRHAGTAEHDDTAYKARMPLQAQKGATILLVDDEVALRTLLTEVLEDAGHTVVQAGAGPEALITLQTLRQIDLLISDVGLPGGLNGMQLADASRQLHPGLKVILITGYVQDSKVRDGLAKQDVRVIIKPFALDIFQDEVKQMLRPGLSGQKLP